MTRASITAVLSVVLLALGGSPVNATGPGTNGRFAVGIDQGNGGEIFTLSRDGSDRQQITHSDRHATGPFWFPDASKIVYELDVPGEECGSIVLMNSDGSSPIDLTAVAPRFTDICAQGPSFTPNGRRILFAAEAPTLPTAIWSVNLHGKNVRRVIVAQRVAHFAPIDRIFKSPRVSPDGRTLCFEVEHFLHKINSNEKGLFAMRMNGTHLRQIVPFSYDVGLKGGDWGPRGNLITFTDYAGPLPAPAPQNLFTVRPDGTHLRQLTHYHRKDTFTGGAAFSPDGRWIAFRHQVGDRFVLWKIHPDGGTLRRITRFKNFFFGTDWGPRPG